MARNSNDILELVSLFQASGHTSRPSFTEVVEALSEPEIDLLCWSEEDTAVHPQAEVLGAPLEAGVDLYPELQGTYVVHSSVITHALQTKHACSIILCSLTFSHPSILLPDVLHCVLYLYTVKKEFHFD